MTKGGEGHHGRLERPKTEFHVLRISSMQLTTEGQKDKGRQPGHGLGEAGGWQLSTSSELIIFSGPDSTPHTRVSQSTFCKHREFPCALHVVSGCEDLRNAESPELGSHSGQHDLPRDSESMPRFLAFPHPRGPMPSVNVCGTSPLEKAVSEEPLCRAGLMEDLKWGVRSDEKHS